MVVSEAGVAAVAEQVAVGNALSFRTMSQLEIQIPRDIIPEVLALAAQNYANQTPNCSVSEWVDVGAEIYLPPELIEQTIQEIQAQRAQRIERQN